MSQTHTNVIIGLDAGTSVIKAVAFNMEGKALATHSVPNALTHTEGAGVEQDMSSTWQTALHSLQGLSTKVENLAKRTLALGLTAQGDGTWLLDKAMQPLRPALLWLDGRSGAIVEALGAQGKAQEIYNITGTALNPSLQSMQLLWLKQQDPELLNHAYTAFHAKDWLYYNFTGERVTDASEAVHTFGNARSRNYDDTVLEILGLSSYKPLLPELLPVGKHSGSLLSEPAAQCGLLEGTPVVLGSIDIIASGIGIGLNSSRSDLGCSILGSTAIHQMLTDDVDPIFQGPMSGYTLPWPEEGWWLRLVSNMAATLNIEWLLDTLIGFLLDTGVQGLTRQELLKKLEKHASAAAPGKLLYHPYIYPVGERGPFIKPNARAQFLGLSVNNNLYDMVRAIYEGVAFAAHDCYDAMPHIPNEIHLAGGGAQSSLWRTLLASMLRAKVYYSRQGEAGACGAAMIALWTLGHYPSLEAATQSWVNPYLDDVVEPDDALAALYDQLFPIYQQTSRHMFEPWDALSAVKR